MEHMKIHSVRNRAFRIRRGKAAVPLIYFFIIILFTNLENVNTNRHLHRRDGERHLCRCTGREADQGAGVSGVCPAVVRTCWCSVSVGPLAQPGNLSPHSRSAIRDTGEARIPSPAPRGAFLSDRLVVRRL